LVTGVVTTYGSEVNGKDRDSLLFIDRIESKEGELLYRPERQSTKVVGDKARYAIGHILENVVKFGTGRAAATEVRLMVPDGQASAKNKGILVPVLGKTGTANDYTNASFFGYLPGIAEDGSGLELQNGYAVGVYVGYDDNDAMRKSSIKIAGAAGALPSWIEIVNGLVEHEEYGSKIDAVDLSFGGLQLNRRAEGLLNLIADPEQGGIIDTPARLAGDGGKTGMTIMTYGSLSAEGRFVPDRSYQPYWRAGEGP
jgi:hypothetical protein